MPESPVVRFSAGLDFGSFQLQQGNLFLVEPDDYQTRDVVIHPQRRERGSGD